MSLILGGKGAGTPLHHGKLNIDIYNEQELSYLIFNYPLFCREGFISDELTSWLRELHRDDLADTVSDMMRKHESYEAILKYLAGGLNYLSAAELESLSGKLVGIRHLSPAECAREEGRIYFERRNYTLAGESFSEAVKLLEAGYRRASDPDMRLLRSINELKADILCDMAAVKMQLFDDRSAIALINESLGTYGTKRAERMRYLIDGGGNLTDGEKAALDKEREEAYLTAAGSPAYSRVEEIFSLDGPGANIAPAAKKLLATWKNNLRKM